MNLILGCDKHTSEYGTQGANDKLPKGVCVTNLAIGAFGKTADVFARTPPCFRPSRAQRGIQFDSWLSSVKVQGLSQKEKTHLLFSERSPFKGNKKVTADNICQKLQFNTSWFAIKHGLFFVSDVAVVSGSGLVRS